MAKDVYVITGGSGGMGKATAELAGARGTVLLADLSEERLIETTEELARKGITDVHFQAIDITSKEQVQKLADRTAELGRLKGLVHTAGLSPTMAGPKRITDVNLIGTANVLEAFFPLANGATSAVMISSMSAYMVPKDGAYMDVLKRKLAENIVETTGHFTQGDSGSAYSMSKLAVHLLVEDQAWAWGEKGARLNSVSPGTINTPMGRQEASRQAQMKVMLDHTPLRREGEAAEIASAIDFLLSDAASYITGIDLRVDGGIIANLSRMRAEMN